MDTKKNLTIERISQRHISNRRTSAEEVLVSKRIVDSTYCRPNFGLRLNERLMCQQRGKETVEGKKGMSQVCDE